MSESTDRSEIQGHTSPEERSAVVPAPDAAPPAASTPDAPATCDSCGTRAWCQLTSWKEGVRVVGAFLCDSCRQAIPNDERGWGRDA